jgi:predicted restriction endonuclease
MFSILMASHIVPWAKCETNKERLDPFNGLLLTPNLDKLFDQGLISFKNDGTVLLSKELGAKQRAALGVTERSRLRFVRPTMIPYLKRHRDLFSKKLRTRNTGAK